MRDALRTSVVVAVDLGFSETHETCGLAWRAENEEGAENATFDRCATRVVSLLRASRERSTLVLEAPLSGCFKEGNPTVRFSGDPLSDTRSFESGRGWYYGAGGGVCLAAIFFLRRLRSELKAATQVEVAIFEGFVSFKTEKSDHLADARALLACFLSAGGEHVVRPPQGGEVISMLSLLGGDAGAPLVLLPKR